MINEINNEPFAPQKLQLDDGSKLAYYYTPGNSPGIIFLGGFNSNMTGTKAKYLENVCKVMGKSFIRFDYSGHGQSDGEFTEGTIEKWTNDSIEILEKISKGKQILVGSSMGGWLMVRVSLKIRNKISGLLGIAAAPDFTNRIWDNANQKIKDLITKKGIYFEESQYSSIPTPISLKLIIDGKNNSIMNKKIPIDIPVRLIHGLKDKEVPWQDSVKLANKISGENVTINLLKNGDHRLSKDEELKIISQNLCSLIKYI